MNNYRDLDPQGILDKREKDNWGEKEREGDQTRSVRKNERASKKALLKTTSWAVSEILNLLANLVMLEIASSFDPTESFCKQF